MIEIEGGAQRLKCASAGHLVDGGGCSGQGVGIFFYLGDILRLKGSFGVDGVK